jgi:ribosome-associated toxin RatA of RatAB toxin-antitoxin module
MSKAKSDWLSLSSKEIGRYLMTKIERSALVMHSAQTMFDLVNDVASYPSYMEGCVGAKVFERADDYMLARLELKKGGVGHSFITRNELIRPSSIEMNLQEGPFQSLKGIWQFKPLTDQACKVSFNLDFEFSNKGIELAGGKLFASVANNLVDSLCRRADHIKKINKTVMGV